MLASTLRRIQNRSLVRVVAEIVNIVSRLPDATRVAGKVPLVHVCGRIERLTLAEYLSFDDPRIPTSEHPTYVGSLCRAVERACGFPPSIYFYAGRADPRFGSVALAFAADIEERPGVAGTVTRFDTGYVFRGPVVFPYVALEARVAFILENTIPLIGWREQFAKFLCFCMSNLARYWYPQGGPDCPHACPPYSPANDWNVWAWEVRLANSEPGSASSSANGSDPMRSSSETPPFPGPVSLLDCSAWSVTRQELTLLWRQERRNPSLSSNILPTNAAILLDERELVTPHGSEEPCIALERWIQDQLT